MTSRSGARRRRALRSLRTRRPRIAASTRRRVSAATSERPLMTFETVGHGHAGLLGDLGDRRGSSWAAGLGPRAGAAMAESVPKVSTLVCRIRKFRPARRRERSHRETARTSDLDAPSERSLWFRRETNRTRVRNFRARRSCPCGPAGRPGTRPGEDADRATVEPYRQSREMRGGRLVSIRWRSIGDRWPCWPWSSPLCNGGASTAPSAAPSAAAPSAAAPSARPVRGRLGRRRAGDRSTGGTSPPASAGKADFQADRRRVHGGPPERQDQHHGPRERGLQDQARGDPAGRRIRTCSSRGAAAPWPPRRTPACSRTSPRAVADWKDTINPGRDEHLPLQGRPVRHPVGHGHDRLLVQQGPLREGRDHRPAHDVGRVPRRRRRSSRPPASPRSRSPARTSGRRCTCGRTCCFATAAATPSAR